MRKTLAIRFYQWRLDVHSRAADRYHQLMRQHPRYAAKERREVAMISKTLRKLEDLGAGDKPWMR